MTVKQNFAIFLDFDNTLIDNDALKDIINARIIAMCGDDVNRRFWEAYERARLVNNVVDIPLSFHYMRPELTDETAHNLWDAFWDAPYSSAIFPGTLEMLQELRRRFAFVGVVSDGDAVYQPHKIDRSGVTRALDGLIKVFLHKQDHMDELLRWAAANAYVMVDDKPDILADFKQILPMLFVTAHVRQGHYANSPHVIAPDVSLNAITDLLQVDIADLVDRARHKSQQSKL